MAQEIRRCEAAGAIAAALAVAFISIDTMTFLSLPAEAEAQGRADFIAWADTYLKAHPDQPYQYRGIDVDGARCAMLHSFGSTTRFTIKIPTHCCSATTAAASIRTTRKSIRVW